MSGVRISELPAASVATAADQFEVNQAGTTRRVTLEQILGGSAKLIYATAYGVVVDDPAVDPAVNTANLQAALTAAEGGTLILPPGEIRITGPHAGTALYCPVGGVSIKGAGRFSTIIRNASDSSTISAVDADFVDISDLGIDGAQSANLPWQIGITFRGVVRAGIRNCRFTRIGQTVINACKLGFGGSDATPNGTRQSERIDISHNLFEDNWGSVGIVTKYIGVLDMSICDNVLIDTCVGAISVESEHGLATAEHADRIMVCRNKVRGSSWARIVGGGPAAGITISEQARNIICNENIVEDITGNTVAVGILLGSSSTQSDTEIDRISLCDNNIANIVCLSGRSHGIQYETGDVDLTRLTIHGNFIDGADAGLSFSTASAGKTLGTIKDLSVIGNKLSNIAEIGIWTINVSSSGELPVERATFVANDVIASGDHGMALFLKHSTLSANTVSGAGGSGIVILAGSSDCLLIGNRCIGNNDSGIAADGNRLRFVANQCDGNGQDSAATQYGIYLAPTSVDCQIINNQCSDMQGSPTQDVGIRAPAGTLLQGNITKGNVAGPYFAGGPFAAWVVTFSRPATVPVASDNVEHTVLTETVPQNRMSRFAEALRLTVRYFGTWTLGTVVFRVKLGASVLHTVTLPIDASTRNGTIIWELHQTGSATARSSMGRQELLAAGTTVTGALFDVAFATSGGDQNVTVTAQIANAADTMSVLSYTVEHLGW